MSRVIIEDICQASTNMMFGSESTLDKDIYYKFINIEVVPRKMVEMIIEKCKEIQHDNDGDYEPAKCGKWCASDDIKEYAESLLKQFEA